MKVIPIKVSFVIWKLLLLILGLIACGGIFLYYYPITINVNILPYGSFRIKYKLFEKHVVVDNIIINKYHAYIQPIAIPLVKAKIPRIYIGLDNGYIIIRNLKPLDIRNNQIEFEAKDVCLSRLFPNILPKNLSDMEITTNATLTLLDNKQFGLDVHNLSVVNTPVSPVHAQLIYCNGNLGLTINLPKYNHTLKCNGKFDISRPFNWNLNIIGLNSVKVKNLKIKDINYNGNVKYRINWLRGYHKNKLQCKITSENTCINTPTIKYSKLGNICLNASYVNNQINASLELSNFKHTINCTGIVQSSIIDLNIVPETSINIKNLNISNDLYVSGLLKYVLQLKRVNGKNIANGYINLSNGSIHENNNILLQNIEINAKLNNDLLLLQKCEATSENFLKGQIKATGKLNINNLDMNMRIQVPNGRLHNVPILQSGIKIDCTANGGINSPNIDGIVTLINPAIDATSTISGSMTSTDIAAQFMNKNKPKSPNLNERILPINAKININITPKIIINGAGLQSTWSGGGYFIAKKKQPIKWDLKFNILNGQYEIVNKKAKLSAGEILFNSNIPNYYKITIVGQKKIGTNDTIGIKFIQYNDDTKMDFFSTTMRSKHDILSLFLFGKENSELSTSEAYSLGLLAQNLATGNDNIFSKLNKMLKIDTFGIKHNTGTSENYNTVVLGKKVGKWHLSFEQGKNLDDATLSIDRKIKKRSKLSLSLSKKNGLEGGLMWSKRY